jgi:ubiquinone/menaquinone biosynthesis C-methylase UbiE
VSCLGTDLSWPMLRATVERAASNELARRLLVALAPMDHLPFRDQSSDLIHGATHDLSTINPCGR